MNFLSFNPFCVYLVYVPGKRNIKAVLNRELTASVWFGGLYGFAWGYIRWRPVKWCNWRLMWGSVGDPLLLSSTVERSYQRVEIIHILWTQNEQRLCLSSFFISQWAGSGLAALRLSRLSWSKYQAWFGVVNLDPGSLESKEGSKLVLIGTLFLPLTLARAPLWAIGCLKLVTAVVFQPLFRGQHTDFT